MQLQAKYKGQILELSFPIDTTILTIKEHLFSLTDILPIRQKLVGLNHHGRPGRYFSTSCIQIELY